MKVFDFDGQRAPLVVQGRPRMDVPTEVHGLTLQRSAILAWWLSITMDVGFCLEAVEKSMARYGKPKIFNTDQGSQFTSRAFMTMLIGADVKSAWMARALGGTMFS